MRAKGLKNFKDYDNYLNLTYKVYDKILHHKDNTYVKSYHTQRLITASHEYVNGDISPLELLRITQDELRFYCSKCRFETVKLNELNALLKEYINDEITFFYHK